MTAQRFRKKEVRTLLLENGFVIRRLTYWTTLLLPLAVVARTLRGSKQGRDFDAHGFRNDLFEKIMSFELALLKNSSLPFGVALFAVAEKLRSNRAVCRGAATGIEGGPKRGRT